MNDSIMPYDQEKIKEMSEEFIENLIGAVLGDPVACVKCVKAIGKIPLFLRERWFWIKMDSFVNGVYLDEKDREKLSKKLDKDGKKKEYGLRLLECIDKVDSQQKNQ